MDAFDATLKRAFAEAHEPADNGFAARVSGAVARRETAFVNQVMVQAVLMAIAAAAIGYGVLVFLQALGPQIMASLGLEVARAYGAVGGAQAIDLTAMGAGLTQMLFVLGALATGAAIYRGSRV